MVSRIGSFDYINNDLLQRLSKIASGKQIFSAADDAAGMAISQIMTSQYKGMQQAINNVQNAYSMLNVASGAMGDIQDTMSKMKELSVEAANGIYTDQDKQDIQQEYSQLAQHLEDVYKNTQFNGKPLFQNDQMTLQVGPNSGDTQTIDIPDLGKQIQALSKINLTSDAQSAIKTIDNMQLSVSSAQSTLGSIQNNLDEQTNNLMVSYENTVASQSQIVDADMAKEMLMQTTDKIKSTASLYSVIDFKNTTLAYMESLLSG
jgi:flagellin